LSVFALLFLAVCAFFAGYWTGRNKELEDHNAIIIDLVEQLAAERRR
jgi:hypothetical protein